MAHIQFEGKKHALRQTKDGVTFTLVIHPNDLDARLLTAEFGKVYQVVLVDMDDIKEQEQPDNPLVQQAAIISNDPAWNSFVAAKYPGVQERGAEAMRIICGVQSRKEILPNTPAGKTFLELRSRFNYYKDFGK